jgi:hypothetical protein
MRPRHHTLDRRQVHRSATAFLQVFVPLRDPKRKATVQVLESVLLVVAERIGSIHDA